MTAMTAKRRTGRHASSAETLLPSDLKTQRPLPAHVSCAVAYLYSVYDFRE